MGVEFTWGSNIGQHGKEILKYDIHPTMHAWFGYDDKVMWHKNWWDKQRDKVVNNDWRVTKD